MTAALVVLMWIFVAIFGFVAFVLIGALLALWKLWKLR